MSRYIDVDKAKEKFSDALPIGRSIRQTIDEIPIADVVEVRHGHWLSAYEYSLKFDISEERRNEVKNDRIWKFCCLCDQSAKWDYDYCPNCGAKMDGERSENGK
jgi:hypothetical protein